MEKEGLSIACSILERIGLVEEVNNAGFMQKILLAIFTSLNFYRNHTKNKVIPLAIMKSVHVFFATTMIC